MNRFDALRSYLAKGVTSSHCLFCRNNPDTFIVRGSTKEHTFNLPFSAERPLKLRISYKQNNHLILEKELDDVNISKKDSSLIYYSLSELDTLKFKADDVVSVQLKAEFKNHKIVTSEVYFVEVIDTIDDRLFATDSVNYYAIEATTNNQKLDVVNYFDIAIHSKGLYKCKFILDESWHKFTKVALFKDEYEHCIYTDVTEVDGRYECFIPNILLEGVGKLYVGLSGAYSDGISQIVKPTLWSHAIKIKKSCIEDLIHYHNSNSSNLSELSELNDNVFTYYGVYKGICDDAYSLSMPNELEMIPVLKEDILKNGITFEDYELHNQYNVIAVPKWMNIECIEVLQNNIGIAPTNHTSFCNGNYTFYYFSSKATGKFTSTYIFREVS